jgi:hypothetical protein
MVGFSRSWRRLVLKITNEELKEGVLNVLVRINEALSGNSERFINSYRHRQPINRHQISRACWIHTFMYGRKWVHNLQGCVFGKTLDSFIVLHKIKIHIWMYSTSIILVYLGNAFPRLENLIYFPYIGYMVFPGVKRPGRDVDHPPLIWRRV